MSRALAPREDSSGGARSGWFGSMAPSTGSGDGSTTSPPSPRSASTRSGSSRKGSIPVSGTFPGEVGFPLARPKPELIDFVASKISQP